LTEEVLQEAIAKDCHFIVSHHPLIFKPMKRITGSNLTERLVMKALQHNIALYAMHTNLDSVYNGVSTILARKLGIENLKVLEPRKGLLRKLVTFCPAGYASKVRQAIFDAGAGMIGNYDFCSFNSQGQGSFRAGTGANPFVGEMDTLHFEEETRIETIFPSFLEHAVLTALLTSHPYEEVAYDIYPLENEYTRAGYGVVGNLPEPIDEADFLEMVKARTEAGVVRHSPLLGRKVKKIALCGGSGNFLIKEALRKKADVYLTGELKYHDFFETEGRILLADIGHYESEQFAKELIYSIISEKFTNFATLISEVYTNPVSCL
ncbi:MAG: Nif3-like dinuclear metal center hexameric protein, partial [Bacteroidetes bacterium]|nr:Nif3-like dinuclear metal center hexameric protein [Bacteroidota bacterium]